MTPPRLPQCLLAGYGTLAALVALGTILFIINTGVGHLLTFHEIRWITVLYAYVASLSLMMILGALVTGVLGCIPAIIYWVASQLAPSGLILSLAIGGSHTLLIGAIFLSESDGSISFDTLALIALPPGLLAGVVFDALLQRVRNRNIQPADRPIASSGIR
ncbi:hypothetical protein O2N63_07035 [Aliiroseovarius sp. KMU-50]|uniref:Uncharacterized protein n=1 Tax=Aliiroseovarius salicola TaxID=3009082 RepID=A0ABT4W026_9RHOB|nr:hypothetical protein [Aliiroseovarius sp. KMU-50]MDA5093837.1 hypothetical protein [Aliiroseovarius sp. KMU-50]